MRPPIVKKTNFKSFGTVKLHSRPVYKKGALQLAAAHDSGFDAVDGYSVNSARMSGAWSKADSLCSKRVIPSLTRSGHWASYADSACIPRGSLWQLTLI